MSSLIPAVKHDSNRIRKRKNAKKMAVLTTESECIKSKLTASNKYKNFFVGVYKMYLCQRFVRQHGGGGVQTFTVANKMYASEAYM